MAVGYVRLAVQRADGHGPHIQHGSSEALPQTGSPSSDSALGLRLSTSDNIAALLLGKPSAIAARSFACAILKQRRNGIVVY